MSTAPPSTVALRGDFARDLPELALPWHADEAPDPALLALDEDLADELGLDPAYLRSPEGLRLLVGADVPDDATPVAQAYAGHQFGGFSPRLGDGRALLLGELTDREGRLRDLALKGSGRTPFARGGDGLAALGPMLREHVLSVAMHGLGIPTTRSLAVVATGRPVRRETVLPGALLVRVAASHLRVGSFQFARATGDVDLLRRLADHAVARHHPHAADAANPPLALLGAVIEAQAALVARWMSVGFVHGVMNTDNVTISGETIDYGPCAFLDAFDPAAVFSSIDEGGRYAYGNQPVVQEWNLARLAEALLPLIDPDEERAVALAVEALGRYRVAYREAFTAEMSAKLGLPPGLDAGLAASLVDDLLALLGADRVDLTTFLRRLGDAARGGGSAPARSSSTSPASTPGRSAGSPWGPTARRWIASTRSTCRATTSSRRRSPRPPTVTSDPSSVSSRSCARRTTSGSGWSATPSPPRRPSAPTGPSAAPERPSRPARRARCRRRRRLRAPGRG